MIFSDCQYWIEYDTCTGEEFSCYAEVVFEGEDYYGDCYEIEEMFFGDDKSDSDFEECYYSE